MRYWLQLATLILLGCASSQPTTRPEPWSAPSETRAPFRGSVLDALHQQQRSWQGTPYRLGGTTRRGIDCSAFVQQVYRDSFGIVLPRTTEAQARLGEWVEPESWQPGDLIFFKPERGVRHVGIYLGDGRFLHASKSRGVTADSLAGYWHGRYWTARRHPL